MLFSFEYLGKPRTRTMFLNYLNIIQVSLNTNIKSDISKRAPEMVQMITSSDEKTPALSNS